MSGWDSDDYKDYREEQKKRRAERLPERTAEIMELEEEGFVIKKFTDTHFRVNDILDVYPIHNRFHWIAGPRKGKRGGCPNLRMYIKNNVPCEN